MPGRVYGRGCAPAGVRVGAWAGRADGRAGWSWAGQRVRRDRRAGGQVQRGQAVCSRNSSYMLQNIQHYISKVSIAELGKLSE